MIAATCNALAFAKSGHALLAVIALAALLAGCSEETGGSAAAKPAAVTLEIAGTLPVNEQIERVVDVRSVGSTVLVLNSAEPHLFTFSADGVVLHSGTLHGGGPGEVRRPMALLGQDSAGYVWIYDAGKRGLIGVAPQGSAPPAPEVRLPTEHLPPTRLVSTEMLGTLLGRPWMEVAEADFLIARSQLPYGQPLALRLWKAELVSLSMDGRISSEVDISRLWSDPLEIYTGTGEYMPYPLWGRCATGEIAVYDPGENAIIKFTSAGADDGVITLPEPRRLEVTRDRYWDILLPALLLERRDTAAFRHALQDEWPEYSRLIANHFPEYVSLHCDDHVWLEEFTTPGLMGHGGMWLVVSEGQAPVRYRMPKAFRPLRFTADRIWGVVTDELGVESIAWIVTPTNVGEE